MNESKRFTFYLNDSIYTAYVRYHADGDCDVELDGDGDFSADVYDYAWETAEALGLMEQDDPGDGGDAA